ncbi:hypothetical protein THF1C08_40040 [Vibrio jasicida]|uniref:Uncharacterized protein n=1 Tax=Vibrio jasicida TaxID=766224 RepID=A0AAU9QIB1_9VIBR|nr:hypothetical protein THF1A12_190041 [Vibrio jasicida]CAH1596185.1 hypothetical protein THF1C08_40040 [Vibrio jasicida]
MTGLIPKSLISGFLGIVMLIHMIFQSKFKAALIDAAFFMTFEH